MFWALAVTYEIVAVILPLKIVNQSFCLILMLTMMHHNTKFGNKMFGNLEAIIWTNIEILTICCDLDVEHNNPFFFSEDTLAYDDVSSDQVWLLKNQQFRRYSKKSHILIIWALAVTLTLKIAHNFSSAWLMVHHTRFGNKMFCSSEGIIQTNIHRHFEPSPWLWRWMR